MTRWLHRSVLASIFIIFLRVTVPPAHAQAGTELKHLDASKTPDIAEARKLAEQAGQAARTITDDQIQPQVLRDVASVKAEAGDFEGAQKILRSLGDDELKAKVLTAIATAQQLAGDQAGAAKTVSSIATAQLKVKAYCDIAARQLSNRDKKGSLLTLQAALTTSDAIKDDLGHVMALYDIADGEARTGELTLAAKVAEISKGTQLMEPRSVMIVAIGKANDGDIAGARRKIAALTLDDYKVGPLEAIAAVQLKSGDKQGAAATCKQLLQLAQTPLLKAAPALRVARIQASRGDLSPAKTTIKLVLDAALKDEDDMMLEQVAQTQAELGDVPGALKTLSHIGKLESQFWPRRAIARVKAKDGDIPAALSMMPEKADAYGQVMVLLGTAEGIIDRAAAAKN